MLKTFCYQTMWFKIYCNLSQLRIFPHHMIDTARWQQKTLPPRVFNSFLCVFALELASPWLWLWSEPKCVKAVIRSQIVVLLCCARVCFCFAVCAQMFLFFFPQTHSARVSSKAKRANNAERQKSKGFHSISRSFAPRVSAWKIFDRQRAPVSRLARLVYSCGF